MTGPASKHPAVTGADDPLLLRSRRRARSGADGHAKANAAGAFLPGRSYDIDDEVFFRHGDGPRSGSVVARGKHGCTIEESCGQRHQVAWDRFLGLKGRKSYAARVVDRGAGGAIMERADGRRFFVSGSVPVAEEADALSWDESGTPLPLQKADPLALLGHAIAGLASRSTGAWPLATGARPLLFMEGRKRVP